MRWPIALLVAGCTEHVQLGGDELAGLVALEVSPASPAIAFDGFDGEDQHVAFTALGSFSDGSTRDLTAVVDWSTDNPFPGAFAGPGDYTATGLAAGHVGVRATGGDIEGAAALTITVAATIVDSVFPPASASAFDGAVLGIDPARTPLATYPARDARFPQRLSPILFQHARGADNDTLRLAFESDVLHLTVLTGGDRWQPDLAVWNLIAASHPNAAATLTIEATDSTLPGTLYRGEPIALHFAAGAAADLIYFFSSAAPGVRRGALDAASASTVVATTMDPHHAVTRDGRTMALGIGDRLSTLDLATLTPLIPATAPMGSAAFSPDGALVLVADKGTLTLRDATTGDPVGPDNGKVPLGPMQKGTHPSWSATGDFVVIAMSDMISNDDAKRASIARIPFTEGTWGPVEILVQSTGDMDNNFFPQVGPGDAIAYVHATSGSKAATNAELRLLGPGATAPITLGLASARVGTLDLADLATLTPAWTTGDDGSAWLAFSSTRPYGNVRPATGDSQIWIAGIDLARAGDPSFAGFWLPCQDITAIQSNPVLAPVPVSSMK
jgi:hypothetical protein